MKVVIAPDKFKGSLTAEEVAEAIEKGFRRVVPDVEVVSCPMADGGEGTVKAMIRSTGGERRELDVSGPLPGMRLLADWCFVPRERLPESHLEEVEGAPPALGGIGVVEMAQASGLYRVPRGKKDPMVATTRGTGELIAAALDSGCAGIVVGMGGSATVDGGTGMARALGYRFLDEGGSEAAEGGGGLASIVRIDPSRVHSRLKDVEFVAASDVDNPLCGPEGAAHVYGPQKGAGPEQVDMLEEGMRNLAEVIKRDLDVDVLEVRGAGAAGGLGAGLVAFCGADIRPGVEVVAEVVGLRQKLEGSDLVVTGEGKVDDQTVHGKTPAGVARIARELGIPVAIIGGWVLPEARGELDGYADVVLSVSPGPQDLDTALEEAAQNVIDGAATLLNAILLGKRIEDLRGKQPGPQA